MTGPLVLPEDVEIVALADVPESVREQIEGDAGDYAVTRPRSRVPSKVIDADAAALLREFKTPTTLVQGITRYCKAVNRKPTEILDEVYPFLESCLVARLLVVPGADSVRIQASFATGACIANCQIQECVQVLADSELYRVRYEHHDAALKLARASGGSSIKFNIALEAAILQHLDGRLAPRLLSSGETEDGRAYLVQEWIVGKRAGEPAALEAELPNRPSPKIVEVCARILEAYALLHHLGVVHADVHSNNLLVTESGEIRIIDFGLSHMRGSVPDQAFPPRAGASILTEPEAARAILAGSPPPPATPASDQYSVAAMVYALLSGRLYLDFSYGRDEMLRQISEQAPIPLAGPGLSNANALNAVLMRALEKDPDARFPNMTEMASAFREAMRSSSQPVEHSLAAPMARGAHSPELDGTLTSWLATLTNSLSDSTMQLPDIGLRYPTSSIAFGAAGIAYGLFRIACVREDAELLALAERWLDRAAREIGGSGFYHDDVYVTPQSAGRISLYHSPAGVACAQALLVHSCNDRVARAAAAQRFLQLSAQPCSNVDLNFGKSGTLLALSMMVDAFRTDAEADVSSLLDAGNRLLSDIWIELDARSPISDLNVPPGMAHVGMAQGWAGYLYATLRWCRSAQVAFPGKSHERLGELAAKAQWDGPRVMWPTHSSASSEPSGREPCGGWCNGSAGFVFLFTLAHRLFADSSLLALAEGAGHDAFRLRDEGSSLCCGLTGKAYSQLNLYKCTGDRAWLDNAIHLARFALEETTLVKTRNELRIPFSLYKGDLGLAVLIADLDQPEASVMPFFEDENWPDQAIRPSSN